MLNVLSSFIPFKERIVTIEDTTELRLHQEHVVTLETQAAQRRGGRRVHDPRPGARTPCGCGPTGSSWASAAAAEALDMIQAMNTGHDGSMTTVHANSCREVIERLEVLMLMAADLPIVSIHRQIASAMDLIVHISRLPGGRRVVTQISEVTRVRSRHRSRSSSTDIFNFRDGRALRPTGYLPSFVDSLVEKELVGPGVPLRARAGRCGIAIPQAARRSRNCRSAS